MKKANTLKKNKSKDLTLKKEYVEPPSSVPYLILDCPAKSSALLIESSIAALVRKAARLAV